MIWDLKKIEISEVYKILNILELPKFWILKKSEVFNV